MIFVPEFLIHNEIYLTDFKQSQLEYFQDYSRKRFVVQPYFYIYTVEGHVNIIIKLMDERKKIKKMRIKPFYPQRRNKDIKLNSKMNAIFTLYNRVLRIF